jgi:hypothetical protein
VAKVRYVLKTRETAHSREESLRLLHALRHQVVVGIIRLVLLKNERNVLVRSIALQHQVPTWMPLVPMTRKTRCGRKLCSRAALRASYITMSSTVARELLREVEVRNCDNRTSIGVAINELRD